MAFDDEALNQTMIFTWQSHFKVVRHSFDDDSSKRPGTSKTDENVKQTEKLIQKDC